jgi:ATP diphosphatase
VDSLKRVQDVIEALLGPEGCPWDKQQTPETLCDYVIEEGFELVEAIRGKNTLEAAEELGDLFFLLLFIAKLYTQRGDFTLQYALEANAAKMIRRHPHVFGDVSIADQNELLKNWERIKREEKQENGELPRVFDSLPKGLPTLLRAYRIHSKAARVGFTWATDEDLERQLAAEWKEWENALATGDAAQREQEFGDYLFTLVEYGRRKSIKANAALDAANNKFLKRFATMETLAREQGQDVAHLDLDALNELWDQAKKRD